MICFIPHAWRQPGLALEASELAGCALCLIDQQGKDLGLTFGLPRSLDPRTCFRGTMSLVSPTRPFVQTFCGGVCRSRPSAVLVDWFLATRAWLLGARLAFDPVPRMDYRQHPANTARVRFPFSRDQVISDTALVRQHFQLLLAEPRRDSWLTGYAALTRVAAEIVEEFHRHIVLHPAQLDALRASPQRPASAAALVVLCCLSGLREYVEIGKI